MRARWGGDGSHFRGAPAVSSSPDDLVASSHPHPPAPAGHIAVFTCMALLAVLPPVANKAAINKKD